MKPSIYQASQLEFSYQGNEQRETVLRGIDLLVQAGDFICLTGPSGSGKSTLLNLFGLIEAPQTGSLLFQGMSVKELNEKQLNELRRFHIGFIFQDFQLIDVLSVEENVEFFLTRQKIPPLERKERVEFALNTLGLFDHRNKRPGQLSGGQKQRVAIARALAKRPAVLIADEPTASLDTATGRSILEHLETINKNHGVTVILASHDPMVLEYDVHEVRLQDGKIINNGRGQAYAG
ncbi:MAG: ABC transporter ATP-binding protein [Proteobacteria bacterium]|nr:ABC transporter ATP-binding protein [Pseudomonadota bacterium]